MKLTRITRGATLPDHIDHIERGLTAPEERARTSAWSQWIDADPQFPYPLFATRQNGFCPIHHHCQMLLTKPS